MGMCGPIAMALPFNEGSNLQNLLPGRLVYNAGRLLAYMIIGLIFGLLGNVLVLAGLQQKLSIIAGIVLIIMALFGFFGLTSAKNAVSRGITKMFQGRFGSTKLGSMLSIGVLNGFLPCGLVYIAAAMAMERAAAPQAALFMLFFGLGTFPIMLAVSLSPALLSAKRRLRIKNLSPYIALVMGVLFTLRGLNLDIPMISPKVNVEKETMECCEPE